MEDDVAQPRLPSGRADRGETRAPAQLVLQSMARPPLTGLGVSLKLLGLLAGKTCVSEPHYFRRADGSIRHPPGIPYTPGP